MYKHVTWQHLNQYMTFKSRGHCDNIKVFNQGKPNQIREKSGKNQGTWLLKMCGHPVETWFVVRPWCGAAHIVSRLQSTKCYSRVIPLWKFLLIFRFWLNPPTVYIWLSWNVILPISQEGEVTSPLISGPAWTLRLQFTKYQQSYAPVKIF